MRSGVLNTVLAVAGLGAVSFLVRFLLFAYFFAKPLGDINKTIAKQLQSAQRAMAETSLQDDSSRTAYRNDAEWEAAAFRRPVRARHPADDSDDADAAAQKATIPVVPVSSWVLFASSEDNGASIMHARLALATPDGAPFLTIELSQPKHAIGDAGGAAQIAFASLNQASCGDADGLVMRFDNAAPVRYATKGVWTDAMCHFSLGDFPRFRDALVNASMLFVRIGKSAALTQEIPAPVAGLDWNP